MWLFVLTVAGIVYGSLYPFDFAGRAVSPRVPLAALIPDSRADWGAGNVLANVVLFIPYGLFGALTLRPLSLTVRWLVLLASGFVVAAGLQVGQLWLASRVPDLADAAINMLGLVVGAGLASVPWNRWSMDRGNRADAMLILPGLLIACWVAYKWFPFVPTLDWYTIKQGLKPLLVEPRFEWLGVFRNLVGWLVLAALWRDCRLPQHWLWTFLPLVVLAQGGIAGNPLALDSVVGAALALPAWWLLGRLTARPEAPVLFLLMILLVVQGLHPFVWAQSSFQWLPFRGFLTGSMSVNLISLLFKLYLYGSLVWLVFSSTRVLGAALVVPVILVGLVEVAQTQVAGRGAEITDPLLCVLIWSVLWMVRRSEAVAARSPPAA